MDPSIPRPPGPRESPIESPSNRAAADVGRILGADEREPKRSRIGSSEVPFCRSRRIALFLLGVIVLPWLPIWGPPSDATRVPGSGDAPILGFAFAPDGASVATIQVDGRVALRDTAACLSAHSFLDYCGPGPAQALAFSPDGRSVAVGGVEPDIFLYDVRAGGAGHPLGMPIHWANSLAFSPDGRMLAASSYLHRDILLWDLAAGRQRARLSGHQSPVISLAFAPDGQSLASGA